MNLFHSFILWRSSQKGIIPPIERSKAKSCHASWTCSALQSQALWSLLSRVRLLREFMIVSIRGQRSTKLQRLSWALASLFLYSSLDSRIFGVIVQSPDVCPGLYLVSSIAECIRLAWRYVTSLENQLLPSLPSSMHNLSSFSRSTFALNFLSLSLSFAHSLSQLCSIHPATRRSSLTQIHPTKPTLALPSKKLGFPSRWTEILLSSWLATNQTYF